MVKNNYYEILQIASTGQLEEIHAAYKRMAKECQQDAGDLANFVMRMQKLNEAYSVLSDSEKRAEYDETKIKNDSFAGMSEAEDLEDEDSELEIPIERNESSENLYNLRLESCSAYLVESGWVAIIGEIVATGVKTINNNSIGLYFSVYDSNGKLIGTDNADLKKSPRQSFHRGVDIKPKKAIPAKVRVYFEKYD